MTTTSSLGPGGEFGNYTIESMLGRGGMAVVFLAEDRRLGRQVAIKVLAEELAEDDSFRTRFVRESQLAASLDHPNIIPVYEAGELEGHLFIAMRYVRGTDLRTVILRDGPLDARRTVELVRPIASALDAAHRRGLVHRDVKPANILVAVDEGDEHPYLSDFGLTKHTSSKSGLTKTGTFMGTVDYVAPEQIKGEEVDGRTDEYSLACMVYQCLTGNVPFDKEAEVATMFGHLQDPPPRVSAVRHDLPPAIDEVVARGMAKDRDDRFPTCTAMMQALARAAGMDSGPLDQPTFDPTVVAMAPLPGSAALLPPAPGTEAQPSGASQPPMPVASDTSQPSMPPASGQGPPATPSGPQGTRGGSSSRKGLLIGGIVAAVVAIGAIAALSLGGGGEPAATGAAPGSTVSGPTAASGSNNAVFSNQDPITIPDAGTATPYPSSIQVSGLAGEVTDVNVILNGFEHAFPRDVDMVLVGPTGQTAFLMEGAGGQQAATDVTLAFDDSAPPIPPGKPLVTGTFRPTAVSGDGFGFNGPPPIPDPPYGANLAGFDGTDPNGTWSLFVFDDSEGSAGQIAGGWTLNIEVAGGTGPTGATTALFSDDFSDDSGGWGGSFTPQVTLTFQDGAMVVAADPGDRQFEGSDAITPSSADLSTVGDVRVETTATMLTDSRSAIYGVVCRSATPGAYYYLEVGGNGKYFIGKQTQAGDVTPLDTGTATAINRGPATNQLAAECEGGSDGSPVTLRLSVNGVAVGSAVDAEQPFALGSVGVITEAYAGTPVEVAFDDFVATAL